MPDRQVRNRIGARVRLHLDGEERTTRVVIREDRKPGVVAAPIILRLTDQCTRGAWTMLDTSLGNVVSER